MNKAVYKIQTCEQFTMKICQEYNLLWRKCIETGKNVCQHLVQNLTHGSNLQMSQRKVPASGNFEAVEEGEFGNHHSPAAPGVGSRPAYSSLHTHAKSS